MNGYAVTVRGWLFAALLLLALVVFANGLNHPFMIDDHIFFDEAARNPKNLWINFIPDKAKALGLEGSPTEVYYRPLALIVPKVAYIAFHGNAFLMHVLNLLLLVTASWVLCRWLLSVGQGLGFSCAVAAMVLVHPLNGIIVNFKTAGIFAIQLICMVKSMELVLRDKATPKTNVFAVMLFMAALFFHESAFLLPPVALLTAIVLKQRKFSVVLRQTAWLWAAAVIYFLLRLKWASLADNIFNKFAGYHMTAGEMLASWFSLQAWYVSKIFFPSGIAIFALRPVIHDGIFLWIAAGLGVWAGAVCVVRRFGHGDRVLWLGTAWFFLGLIMMGCGALFHGEELMIEPHWMVFGSIGAFMVIAKVLLLLRNVKPLWSAAVMGVLFAGWIAFGWRYNYLWDDELRYSYHWLEQSPSFKPIHMYIARTYFGRGQLDLAEEHYKAALTGQRPDYLMYANLGAIALMRGDLAGAETHLKRTLAIEPRAKTAMNTLAIVSVREGKMDQAEFWFKKAIEADPFDTTARRNLEFFYRTKMKSQDPATQNIILAPS